MQDEMYKSLKDVLEPQDDKKSDCYIKNSGRNENTYNFSIGPYQIALSTEVKPFIQAIFLKTYVFGKYVEIMDLTCHINHEIKSSRNSNVELSYSDFGNAYFNGITRYLTDIEKTELDKRTPSATK